MWMLAWAGHERCLFLLSSVPPLGAAAWFVWLLYRSPRLILETLASLVPGLQKPTFNADNMACFRLDAGADVLRHLQRLMIEQHALVASDLQTLGNHTLVKGGAVAMRRFSRDLAALADMGLEGEESGSDVPLRSDSVSRLASGAGDSARGEPDLEEGGAGWKQLLPFYKVGEEIGIGEKEILVSPKHLWRLSFVPTFFLCLYFWHVAVLTREASSDFPLESCMGDSKCFYITQGYSVFRYPTYTRLDCDGMREKTLATDSGFFFEQPANAKFYKCYTWVFSFQNVIQAMGDVVALVALITIVILYFCVDVTSGSDTRSLEDLRRQRRWCLVRMIVLGVVGVCSIGLIEFLYGDWTNDAVGYLGAPGLCLFLFIQCQCRRELLLQRIKESGEESEAESSEAASEPPAPPAASAPACRIGRQPSLDALAAPAGPPQFSSAPPPRGRWN